MLNATNSTTRYSWMVSPSTAVTVTTNWFSPETRLSAPVTSNVASGLVVSTTTSTSVTPYSSSTRSPSSTAVPLTVNVFSEVSPRFGRITVTV